MLTGNGTEGRAPGLGFCVRWLGTSEGGLGTVTLELVSESSSLEGLEDCSLHLEFAKHGGGEEEPGAGKA